MLIRKFANTSWVVGSPSAYVCHAHPKTHAIFVGKYWIVQGKPKKHFPSMIALSLHVEAQKARKGARKPRAAL